MWSSWWCHSDHGTRLGHHLAACWQSWATTHCTTRIHLKPPPGPVTHRPEICQNISLWSGQHSLCNLAIQQLDHTLLDLLLTHTPLLCHGLCHDGSQTGTRVADNTFSACCSHYVISGHLGWLVQSQSQEPWAKVLAGRGTIPEPGALSQMLAGSKHTNISPGNCVNMSHELGIITIQLWKTFASSTRAPTTTSTTKMTAPVAADLYWGSAQHLTLLFIEGHRTSSGFTSDTVTHQNFTHCCPIQTHKNQNVSHTWTGISIKATVQKSKNLQRCKKWCPTRLCAIETHKKHRQHLFSGWLRKSVKSVVAWAQVSLDSNCNEQRLLTHKQSKRWCTVINRSYRQSVLASSLLTVNSW